MALHVLDHLGHGDDAPGAFDGEILDVLAIDDAGALAARQGGRSGAKKGAVD